MNLKQLAGAVRRLLNPATGEEDTLKKERLDEVQARPRQAGVRSASPGISVASGLNPGRLAGILRNAADGITRDFLSLPKRWKNAICITLRCCAPAS